MKSIAIKAEAIDANACFWTPLRTRDLDYSTFIKDIRK